MAGKDVDAFVEIDDIVGVSKDPAAMEAEIDLDKLILDHQKEVRMYPDFSRGAGESWGHFAKRMCVEGHTFFDAWLISAGAIGQVMMTTPNAWYLMGLIPGFLIIVWGTLVGIWTIIQMIAMYDDRKRDLILAGEWFDDPDKAHGRKKKSQNQELLAHYVGPWGLRAIVFMSCFSWFGTGVAQILASATNYYSIDPTHDLRTYILAFGFTIIPFGLIPNFRKARLILIVGVFGTLFTGAYGIYISCQKGFAEAKYVNLWPAQRKNQLPIQPFFNGAAILFSIIDHNGIVAETIEAMQHPRKFFKSYCWGFAPLVFMIVPPGIFLNFAFARSGIATAGNFFQLAPPGVGKYMAVWLMILHNVQAWTLWMTAFGFMWEKMIGTHEKKTWIRLGSRLPLFFAILLFAAAFPFYGAVNSFLSGLFSPLLTYTVPCGIFWWHYRHEENRKRCTYRHMRTIFDKFGWRWVEAINLGLVAYGLVLVAMTCTMSTINLIQLSNTFGFFPACYQCSSYRRS